VLCIRLDALGDVLLTAPAMRALKAAHPARRITLCTSSAGASAAPLLPFVDDVLVYDAPWMRAAEGARSAADLVERLRARRFDAAVDFTVYSQSPLPAALVCLQADVPLRLAHCRENPYRLLTDWVRELEPERGVRHEARRQLDLVAAVGVPAAGDAVGVSVPAEARRAMRRRLAEHDLLPWHPWIALHPGASAASRRYPADGFVAAGRALASRGHRLVVVGSDAERDLAREIAAAVGDAAVSLAGETMLVELAALLEQARLLVANNSGPMHLAAAVGTPVVALYALTNPQHAPWQVPHRLLSRDVPCRWCYRSVCPEGHHACLRGVPPDAIVAAVDGLLAETRARPARAPAVSPPPSEALEARG
jgi:lipopolysaccharide heptosyltransferase II